MKYGLAGFPSGENGAWTFCEIESGDFVSFLYGARAHNLYRVIERRAISGAERLPPWSPLTFSESGKPTGSPSGSSLSRCGRLSNRWSESNSLT